MKSFRMQHFLFALLFPLAFFWVIPEFKSEPKQTTTESKEKVVMIFEKKACYGFCPVYKATFYQSGKVKVAYTKPPQETGNATFELSKEEVKTLVNQARTLGFFQMKDRYETLISDFQVRELTLFQNGKPKKVIYTEGASPEFNQFLKDLAELVESNLNVDFRPPSQE